MKKTLKRGIYRSRMRRQVSATNATPASHFIIAASANIQAMIGFEM
jgi:hypothetical protein